MRRGIDCRTTRDKYSKNFASSSFFSSAGLSLRSTSASFCFVLGAFLLWQEVDKRLAILWNKSIDIDYLCNARTSPVSDTGRYHPTIAVADQYDVVKIFEFDDANDILDVSFEIVFWHRQMRSSPNPV